MKPAGLLRYIVFGIGVFFSLEANAVPIYSLTDLGTLGGGFSNATAINNKGQIVGGSKTAQGQDRAFLYDPQRSRNLVDLGTLGGGSSAATDINDFGKIVGGARLPNNGPFRAVLYDGQGNVIDLGPRGATAVNNAGQIVGISNQGAILYDPTGGQNNRQLGTLGGVHRNGGASAINNSGQIVGSSELPNGERHATLFHPSDPTKNVDLGALGSVSVAVDINDSGQAVGSTLLPNGETRAVIYDVANPGNLTVLDSILGSGSNQAMAINDSGFVIGLSTGPTRIPWIFDPFDQMQYDINTLIDPTDSLFGIATINTLRDINDLGQIVGIAGFPSAGQGLEFRAILLTPSVSVPEPSVLALLAVGLGILAMMAPGRREGVAAT